MKPISKSKSLDERSFENGNGTILPSPTASHPVKGEKLYEVIVQRTEHHSAKLFIWASCAGAANKFAQSQAEKLSEWSYLADDRFVVTVDLVPARKRRRYVQA